MGDLSKIEFEKLFRKYFPAMMTFSRRYLKNEDDAREIVQNVFINLWEKRATIDTDESLKSYLFRSVHNRSLNLLRDRKKFSNDEIPESYSDQDVSSHLEQLELEKEIQDAIAVLPEKCRDIFELSRFEGLTYAEIAKKLDISVKTVENQMSKALRILRDKLASYLKFIIWLLFCGINW